MLLSQDSNNSSQKLRNFIASNIKEIVSAVVVPTWKSLTRVASFNFPLDDIFLRLDPAIGLIKWGEQGNSALIVGKIVDTTNEFTKLC